MNQKGIAPLVVLFIVIFLLSIGGGAYYFINLQSSSKISQVKKSSKETNTPLNIQVLPSHLQSLPSATPQSSIQPAKSNDPMTVRLKNISLIFQLPPALTNLGTWKESLVPGDTGSKLCFELDEEPKSRGAVGSCYFNSFVISAVTEDFTAGRGSDFTDLKSGYKKKNNEYYLTQGGQDYKIPTEAVTEITSSSGVPILIVRSAEDESGMSKTGTPFKGTVGAIININNSKYKAITLLMREQSEYFDSAINQDDFKNILSTIQFTN